VNRDQIFNRGEINAHAGFPRAARKRLSEEPGIGPVFANSLFAASENIELGQLRRASSCV